MENQAKKHRHRREEDATTRFADEIVDREDSELSEGKDSAAEEVVERSTPVLVEDSIEVDDRPIPVEERVMEGQDEAEQPCPSYKQFMEYKSTKSKERQSFNCGPKGRARSTERKHVQINVGLMVPHGADGTDLKPLRGKTLPLFTDPEVFEPQNRSTPKHKLEDEGDAQGHSSAVQPGQIVISDAEDLDAPEVNPENISCYSKYTDLYSPNVEQEDEEQVAVNVKNIQYTAMEETDITLPDIVANLLLPIDHKRVSRFNISRANVWDGAVRGFKRTTYSETCDMLVKFTNDTGYLEEGIDTGGPRREFLANETHKRPAHF
ncbi:hypothetical protein DPEC_G00146410 [Dallia pectoralis]|uniref:Uncharacterized protein n=1 Tax=Dallia pectoralis TaxID=75939 RepID=A0ACC2GNU1_DALPE|nr:hypothetical protein DPEC_G00146410 [Dallia pectoralis]